MSESGEQGKCGCVPDFDYDRGVAFMDESKCRIEELERELAEAPTKEQYEELARCIKERDADISRRNGMIVDLHKQFSTARAEERERCAKEAEHRYKGRGRKSQFQRAGEAIARLIRNLE